MLIYSDTSIILAAKHSLVSFHILKNMYDLLLLYLSGSFFFFTFFFKRLFIFIVCVCVFACMCVCAPPFCLMSVKVRKAWEPGGTNGCKSPHACWEPNMGSLKEQYTLLTSVYNPCLNFLDCVHWHQKVSILIILKLIFSFFFSYVGVRYKKILP